HIYAKRLLGRINSINLKLSKRAQNFFDTHIIYLYGIVCISNGYVQASVTVASPLHRSIIVGASGLQVTARCLPLNRGNGTALQSIVYQAAFTKTRAAAFHHAFE